MHKSQRDKPRGSHLLEKRKGKNQSLSCTPQPPYLTRRILYMHVNTLTPLLPVSCTTLVLMCDCHAAALNVLLLLRASFSAAGRFPPDVSVSRLIICRVKVLRNTIIIIIIIIKNDSAQRKHAGFLLLKCWCVYSAADLRQGEAAASDSRCCFQTTEPGPQLRTQGR